MVVKSERFIDDDIVVSGMSGRFPECDTVLDFQQKLISGVDLVKENDSRWPIGYLGTYPRMGFIKDLRNFDAPFFGAHPKLAERTDPIVRVLLETSFEAVIDAGICPTLLRGTETAVIAVVSSNEAADWWSADPDRVNGYEFLGCTRTMYSNRISFAMDLKGPSYTLDSQSSSGLVGIQQGYYMLKSGMVDAVIVAGVNLILNPHFNIMFQKLNMLSPEGKCKTFDNAADGYARSEAGVAIVMQRAKDAKRCYGIIVGTETNCDGYKEYGCNSVSIQSHRDLYKETYEKFHISPLEVSYVEAHGYATKEGDEVELNGIADVFCLKDQKCPLLIGSVKSNMGHAEPVGGLVSLVKVLLTMESDILPPNLHFTNPNENVPALKDGRLKVVDKLTIWNGSYAAVNSFGIGGTNSHVVLRRHRKEKQPKAGKTIPRLVLVSGRTEDAVRSMLDKIKNHYQDDEFCALLQSVFKKHITHYNFRAYAIFGEGNNSEITACTPKNNRPVCFVFSGMGSQWPGMCNELLQLKLFKNTIDRCADVLKTVNFDLYGVLESDDKMVYNNVLNSFVGITCIQIAFVDILRALEIEPDYIIGHSIGEVACAYADGTFTLEQTVLATYWRGKSLLVSNVPPGSMASIGLSVEEATKRIPKEITVACHNSSDNVTISGPPSSVQEFVSSLQTNGIFAREVNSSGIAFHSPYIKDAGAAFKSTLEKVITQPKLRSKRWISTSNPESEWNKPLAQYSSVSYHVNNLLSPVYFQEGLCHIPNNSVVIEIAPHALLQSILKGNLGSNCTHIGLVRRNHSSLADLLTSIGRLYNAELQPQIEKLYPPVTFPVARKTPMIQSLIEWDHSEKWFLVTFLTKPVCAQGEAEFDVDIKTDRYRFLANCIIDKEPTFPVSGYLCLIWEAMAKFQHTSITNVSLIIENFQVLRRCSLSRNDELKFTINVLEKSEECEIRENGSLVARASVKIPKNVDTEFFDVDAEVEKNQTYLPLKSDDVYRDLYTKGYDYKDEFRGIKSINNEGTVGKLKWSENWTTFMESMLQLHILNISKQQYRTINYISKVIIDPMRQINETNINIAVSVNVLHDLNVIKCGGIEIRGIKSTLQSIRTKQPKLITEQYYFVPHITDKVMSSESVLEICTQLVCENTEEENLKIAEIIRNSSPISNLVKDSIDKEPYHTAEFHVYTPNKIEVLFNFENLKIKRGDINDSVKYNLIITDGFFNQNKTEVLSSLISTGFLLSIEDKSTELPTEELLSSLNCSMIAKLCTKNDTYILIRKTPVWKTPMVVLVKNDSFQWIDCIKMAIRKHRIDHRNTLVIFHGQEPTGIIGLMKSIRREPFGKGLRCLFTDNSISPYKIVDLQYINYFRKGLSFNVYQNGEWGSYRHLEINSDIKIECEHAFIGAREIGNFASLSYLEGKMPYVNVSEYPNHKLCYVYYSSIYAHDIRCALGSLPYDDYTNVMKQGAVLGHEYSGRDSNGKRVFGMVGGGALATTVLADCSVMWDVPDHWTLEQASTIPRVYSVAYYALILRGKLTEGETVYINAGIMGLCVACLNVAVGAAATPYIGYNTPSELQYLRETFPQLPVTTFVSLKQTRFEHTLLKLTDGKGVNLIFDTLNSQKRNQFLEALSANGRLVEFEKSSLFNESLGFANLKKNITYHKISHNTLWVSDAGKRDRQLIHSLVNEGVRSGTVKPIVTNIFLDNQIEEAFRVAQSGKFVGKIVIKFRDEEPYKLAIPKIKLVEAYPNAFLDPRLSYIVTGGFTDEGIEMVNWLITRGAKTIIICTQYKPVTGYQSLALRRWKLEDVEIVIRNDNLSELVGAEEVIKIANKLAPVGGIFHLASVSCDCTLEKSTINHFDLPWKSKVEFAKHLDTASRTSCPALKYFVGFSCISSVHGVYGKANISYVCSAMEMVFEQRKAENYPALVVQNGILDVFGTKKEAPSEFAPIKFSAILEKLPSLLSQSGSVISVSKIEKRQKNVQENGILDKIADVLEIRAPEKYLDQTFDEIGMEPVICSEITKILNQYGIHCSFDQLRKLSFNNLTLLK